MRRLIGLFFLFLLAACHARRSGGPIEVSALGSWAADPTDAGLVRLDREGQVVPGAAARWAILDNGRDYIFRIDDESGVTAATVARRLNQALRRHRNDPQAAALAPVAAIAAVTKTVVEIRLSEPQPDLLLLLAAPAFDVGAPTPLRSMGEEGLLLPRTGGGAAPVRLYQERAGKAVARFMRGGSALVLGGTFTDLAIARAANAPEKALRFDPVAGLFGFAVRNATLARSTRQALSLAINRDRLVAAIGAPGQHKATTIGGSTLEPDLETRRATAEGLLGGETPTIRVAIPRGPGARLLFALVAQDWRAIGVAAEAVPEKTPADLALVDLVAPPATLATTACALSAGCDRADRLALIDPPFIPLASPVRWSLVAPSLDLFTGNALGVHPLDQLRTHR